MPSCQRLKSDRNMQGSAPQLLVQWRRFFGNRVLIMRVLVSNYCTEAMPIFAESIPLYHMCSRRSRPAHPVHSDMGVVVVGLLSHMQLKPVALSVCTHMGISICMQLAGGLETNSFYTLPKTAFTAPHACDVTLTAAPKSLSRALSLCVCTYAAKGSRPLIRAV